MILIGSPHPSAPLSDIVTRPTAAVAVVMLVISVEERIAIQGIDGFINDSYTALHSVDLGLPYNAIGPSESQTGTARGEMQAS